MAKFYFIRKDFAVSDSQRDRAKFFFKTVNVFVVGKGSKFGQIWSLRCPLFSRASSMAMATTFFLD